MAWIIFAPLAVVFVFWLMLRSRAGRFVPPPARPLEWDEQPELVHEVMQVQQAEEFGGMRVFHGRLKESASRVYARLKASVSEREVPLIRDEGDRTVIVLMPRPVEQALLKHRVRPWVHIALFLATIATTTLAGAAQQGVDLIREPGRVTAGLPFSLALLAILGCHEMGHYFAARRHGVNVTPPYFIPVPFALGTFGAFIKMRSPTENRRQLFDIAIAGPLAGLVVALPILYFGFQSSQVLPGGFMPPDGGTPLHPSLLFVLVGKLALGQQLLSGTIVRLSPLAFAGWLGLFVTALNLLPIGQLDGGHIMRAMFGTRIGQYISAFSMWALLAAALFLWPGLMLFALFVFFMAGRPAPPLNDLSPVSPAQRALGYATFAILAAIIVPGM